MERRFKLAGWLHPGTHRPNTVAVPILTWTANLYLFAKAGRWNCPDPQGDCDGILEGEPGHDSDGDGTPEI